MKFSFFLGKVTSFNTFLLIVLSFANESNSLPFLSFLNNFTISNMNRKMDNWGWGWNCNTIGYAFKNGKNKIFKKIEEKPKESALVATGVATIGILTWFGCKYIKNKKTITEINKSTVQVQQQQVQAEQKEEELAQKAKELL